MTAFAFDWRPASIKISGTQSPPTSEWTGSPVDYFLRDFVREVDTINDERTGIHQIEVHLRRRSDGPFLPDLPINSQVIFEAATKHGVDHGVMMVASPFVQAGAAGAAGAARAIRLVSSGVFTIADPNPTRLNGEPEDLPGVFRQTVWERPAPPIPAPEPDQPAKRSWRDETPML